jgi:hypothetical protein
MGFWHAADAYLTEKMLARLNIGKAAKEAKSF